MESSESGSKSDSKSDAGSCECPDGTTGSPIRLELEETNRKKGSSSESSESGSESGSCECGGAADSDSDVIGIGIITAAPAHHQQELATKNIFYASIYLKFIYN